MQCRGTQRVTRNAHRAVGVGNKNEVIPGNMCLGITIRKVEVDKKATIDKRPSRRIPETVDVLLCGDSPRSYIHMCASRHTMSLFPRRRERAAEGHNKQTNSPAILSKRNAVVTYSPPELIVTNKQTRKNTNNIYCRHNTRKSGKALRQPGNPGVVESS